MNKWVHGQALNKIIETEKEKPLKEFVLVEKSQGVGVCGGNFLSNEKNVKRHDRERKLMYVGNSIQTLCVARVHIL